MSAVVGTAIASATVRDPRWQAILARAASADGQFVYAVTTTGVYCRPSCAARRARPENVRFYDSCEHAEQSGFRACKRCKPNADSAATAHAIAVTAACRLIEGADTMPSLASLASHVGLSVYHFHRIFRRATGLTPRQYAASCRERRVREQLQGRGRITDAIYDAGYASSSRFYEGAAKALGMTPREYRAGGAAANIQFAVGRCSLGFVLVAQSERGICAILLGDDSAALVQDLKARFPRASLQAADAQFEQLVAAVVSFVEAPRLELNLPLDVRGTAFQRRVWQTLRDIPAGETISYAQLAERIGAPSAVRAVAQACAANALAVAIPCHRVVRSDGTVSGYRWGVERKRALLKKEQVDG